MNKYDRKESKNSNQEAYLIETTIIERYADKQTIITEGIVSTKAYIILSGECKVLKKVGDKNVVIGTLKQWDIFGEMGLIGNSSRTASVIAVGDVNLGVVDRERFNELLQRMPEEMQCVVKALIDRLKLTTKKLAQVALQFENVKNSMNSLSTKTIHDS